MKIKRIFAHANTLSESNIGKCKSTLCVNLTQKGSTFPSYEDDKPIIIPKSEERPPHYAVDMKDAMVKAGELCMKITLKITNVSRGSFTYDINDSNESVSPTTSEVSDKCVRIALPASCHNLLLGIEYSLD